MIAHCWSTNHLVLVQSSFFPLQIFLLQLNCCLQNNWKANWLYFFQLQNNKQLFETSWHFYALLQQWSQGKNVSFNQILNCCLISNRNCMSWKDKIIGEFCSSVLLEKVKANIIVVIVPSFWMKPQKHTQKKERKCFKNFAHRKQWYFILKIKILKPSYFCAGLHQTTFPE